MKRIERNPQETKQKILSAAMEEFTTVGYHGARVDNIVKKADVNKRMVYHYFESKEGLFKTLMEQELQKLQTFTMEEPTENVFKGVDYWFQKFDITKNFFKLSLSIDSINSDQAILFEDERKAIFKHSIDIYTSMQKKGILPDNIDPSFYLLAMVSLLAMPMILPALSKIITDEDSDSEKFKEEYNKVLKLLLADNEL